MEYLEKSTMPGSADESLEGLLLVGVLLLLCAAAGARLEYGGGSDVNVWSKIISLLLAFPCGFAVLLLPLISIAFCVDADWRGPESDTALFDISFTQNFTM